MRRKLSHSLKTCLQGVVKSKRGRNVRVGAYNTGFTLMEVIIASVLLLVAIIPILKALTISQVTARTIEYRTTSLLLAQSRLDRIRTLSVYDWTSSYEESSTALDGAYLCTVTDTSEGTNLREIAVSVGYDQDGDNVLDADEIEVTLSSYVARRW